MAKQPAWATAFVVLHRGFRVGWKVVPEKDTTTFTARHYSGHDPRDCDVVQRRVDGPDCMARAEGWAAAFPKDSNERVREPESYVPRKPPIDGWEHDGYSWHKKGPSHKAEVFPGTRKGRWSFGVDVDIHAADCRALRHDMTLREAMREADWFIEHLLGLETSQ